MRKNPNFIGQPIFSQLLNLIDRGKIKSLAREHGSDRYTKSFDTYHHLVTMLYCVYHGCTSLREVSTGLQACFKKLNHLGLTYCVRRSTLSDANSRRSSEVFESIYMSLREKLTPFLSDSQMSKQLFIADSTTISLFKEILKNAGTTPANGRRKGGMKVHTLIRADQDVPCLIRMTAASHHDVGFIQNLSLPKGSIIVFDRGYTDYTQYEKWTVNQVSWVTRIRNNGQYTLVQELTVPEDAKKAGVLSDKRIILGHTSHKKISRVEARLISYCDNDKDRGLEFITNNMDLDAKSICDIYRRRWQIELLFKRIKQNYPLQYFLGDNPNALEIQTWSVLIADLLMKYIQRILQKKWSYSNLKSMIRLHLMTYIHLIDFLNNPDTLLINRIKDETKQQSLFDST